MSESLKHGAEGVPLADEPRSSSTSDPRPRGDSRRRESGFPMLELELPSDGPALELEALSLPTGRVYDGPPPADLPPAPAEPALDLDLAVPQQRAASDVAPNTIEARTPQKIDSKPMLPVRPHTTGRLGPIQHFDAPPEVSLYHPAFFIGLLAIGATLTLLGITQLPFVREALHVRHQFLGIQASIAAFVLGVAAIVAAVKYHATRGETDGSVLSGRALAVVLAVPIVLVIIAAKSGRSTGASSSDEPASPVSIYQPGFRRAFVEQLKLAYRDATIEPVASEPGGDPDKAGATLRFFTEDCSQDLVDRVADDPRQKLLLRRAGFARISCIGTGPGGTPAFQSAPF